MGAIRVPFAIKGVDFTLCKSRKVGEKYVRKACNATRVLRAVGREAHGLAVATTTRAVVACESDTLSSTFVNVSLLGTALRCSVATVVVGRIQFECLHVTAVVRVNVLLGSTGRVVVFHVDIHLPRVGARSPSMMRIICGALT